MQYLFHKQAGDATLVLSGDEHRYVFKVRRHREGEVIALRNLEDSYLFYYKIGNLDKKEAHLILERSEILEIKAKKPLHIGWCLIDPKSVERVLPSLNEMGVERITFLLCQRSQKSFKLDMKRFEKIVLNSSQQSGRSRPLELEMGGSLEEFLKQNPRSVMLNFSKKKLSSVADIETMVIGCEGGFTAEEVALFSPKDIVGLDTPLILKSESAVSAVASMLLL